MTDMANELVAAATNTTPRKSKVNPHEVSCSMDDVFARSHRNRWLWFGRLSPGRLRNELVGGEDASHPHRRFQEK
jgi:hypothetical protein